MPQEQQDEAAAQLAGINTAVKDGLVILNQIKLEQEGVEAGIDRLNGDKTKLQMDIDAMNTALDAATVARAGKITELSDINIQISAAEADLQTALTDINVAKVTKEQVVTDTKAAQAEIISDAKAELADVSAKKDDLEKGISTLADQAARLTDSVAGLNAQMVSLNAQLKIATTTLADLNTKIDAATATLAELQTKSDSLQSDIVSKTAQSTSLDTDIASKSAFVADLNQKIIDLEAQLAINDTKNVDFLKARANVVELQRLNEQRADFLKQKYGDLGDSFN